MHAEICEETQACTLQFAERTVQHGTARICVPESSNSSCSCSYDSFSMNHVIRVRVSHLGSVSMDNGYMFPTFHSYTVDQAFVNPPFDPRRA